MPKLTLVGRRWAGEDFSGVGKKHTHTHTLYSYWLQIASGSRLAGKASWEPDVSAGELKETRSSSEEM